MIRVELTSKEIPALETDDSHENEGSEIIFHGRVRRSENNEDILGLEYEHYPGMTEKKMNELAEQTVAKFGISEISCIHRVGFVHVGEISVRIVIWSGHRTEGLTALDWFIVQLKKDVPIWKWGVRKDGNKFPSHADPESLKNSKIRQGNN